MPRERQVAPSLPSAYREAMHELRADYNAGTNTRYRPQPPGVLGSGTGADYHYKDETKFLRMIERSRHFDRNNMVVGQAVNRLTANVVQDGFTLDVQTGDRGLDREQNARWYDWAENEDACDAEGEKTFCEYEALAFRHCIVDGDIVFLPLRSGHLQAAEAHRMRRPRNTKRNVVHGILLEEQTAKRLEYWITKEDLDPLRPLVKVEDIEPYPVRDEEGHRQVFHIYDPKRTSQRRGVTALAPCVDPVGMHDDLQFATLVKSMVASCFAIFEEQALAPSGGRRGSDNTPIKTGEEYNDPYRDGSERTVQGASPGMRVRGKPGTKLHGFAPNIPNPEFFPHAMLILSFIAINLDMPVQMLLLDASNSNFSSWRGTIDQARMRFRHMQNWLRFKFHSRVYRWKIRQWMAEDPAMRTVAQKSNVDIFGHIFHLPTWPYIEPMKDAAADLIRERNLLVSRRRRCAERGYEWPDLAREIVADNSLVLELAYRKWQRLKKKYPDWDVSWREIVCLPTPDGIQLAINPAESDASESPPAPAKSS